WSVTGVQTCALPIFLGTCYDMAERIAGWSQVGVELAKRLLWSGLDAASLEAHMRHEGVAQLYVRNLTGNFEEMIRARKDGRTPRSEERRVGKERRPQ